MMCSQRALLSLGCNHLKRHRSSLAYLILIDENIEIATSKRSLGMDGRHERRI